MGMLVLGRWPQERIVIDPEGLGIVVSILEIRGSGDVKVGVEAPKGIAVHREEHWERIQAERRGEGGGRDAV